MTKTFLGAITISLLSATFSPSARLAAQVNARSRVDAKASMNAVVKMPAVQKARSALEAENAWTIEQQVALCEIPSPPFGEAARAAEYQSRLAAIGVSNTRIDQEGNVIGEIRGSRPGPTILLSGHLDTVFPEGTDVKVRREGTKLFGPGIGDDCRGLAVNLAVARQIIQSKVQFSGTLLVVGTVGEEGAGNLRGVRALFNSPLKDSIDVFLSVDGTGFGITNGGVGSNRYRVTYFGPGGHSFGAFGMPNPIHALGRAIAKIAELEATVAPKVTFNVGVISGGTSVNSISASGSMDIDLRSESATALAAIDTRLQSALKSALAEERARWPKSKVALEMKIDTIGLRPAGNTPDSAFVVRIAQAAAEAIPVQAELTTSSTDANIAMSKGIPAITLDGGGIGRNSHSLEESYDDGTDGFRGPQWVMLVVLGLLGVGSGAR